MKNLFSTMNSKNAKGVVFVMLYLISLPISLMILIRVVELEETGAIQISYMVIYAFVILLFSGIFLNEVYYKQKR